MVKLVLTKESVANKFCDIFCNVADDLVKKLKPPSGLFNNIQEKSFYSKKGVLEFFFFFKYCILINKYC